MRIGGIASGMDTEQMIQSLMKVERLRVDRFFQQEQRLKWKQEAYTSINRRMANFILDTRRAFGLTRSTSTGVMLSGGVNTFTWVKKATSSHESLLRATANANAMAGTHTVKIEALADTARVTSQDIRDWIDENGNFKEDIHGSFVIKTSNGEKTFTLGNGEGEIKTISGLTNAINSATDLGLRAAYDRDLGRFMISTRETGANKSISIYTNDAQDTFLKNIFGEGAEVLTDDGIKGKNAKIYFNGNEIQKTTNNFTIFGINLQLQEADPEREITIRVDTDVDGMVDKIKAFVEEYNKIIDEINGQINQKFYRDFPPLTKEQKEAMSEKEIELWEEKSKSGLLRGDSSLTRILQNTRNLLYENVEGVLGNYKHITELGITTGTYQDGGKLIINEEKLRSAIANDPEGVLDVLFKTPPSNLEGSEKLKNTGLVHRIYDSMIEGMKEIIRRSGPGEDASLLRNVQSNILIDFVTKQSSISLLDRDLNSINSRIMREEEILKRREDRYWQQFTAMEKALSQMHSQSAWLMAQMGMGSRY